MIDTHAHITSEFYSNIDSVVNELKENNILCVINCADDIKSSHEVIFLSKKYNTFLYPSIGVHPQNIDLATLGDLNKIESLINSEKIIAIGEIGLDYNYTNENKEKQKDFFIKQIDIANKYKLPIVVHTRDSIQDCLDILKEHKSKGIIHCFTGSLEMAKEFINLGFYLGIGGVLTFKNSNLYKVIENVSLENIVLETDSPFLSPEPFRGQTNTPKNVFLVAKKIAEIKSIKVEEVIEITTNNSHKIFDI